MNDLQQQNEQLKKALNLAKNVIENYEMDIQGAKDLIGVDLVEKGFCQGSVYENALRMIDEIAEGKERELPKTSTWTFGSNECKFKLNQVEKFDELLERRNEVAQTHGIEPLENATPETFRGFSILSSTFATFEDYEKAAEAFGKENVFYADNKPA